MVVWKEAFFPKFLLTLLLVPNYYLYSFDEFVINTPIDVPQALQELPMSVELASAINLDSALAYTACGHSNALSSRYLERNFH